MHQQINDFGIANFRSLRDLKIEEPRLLNILIGRNDVGKTSVLEAIFLVTGIDVIELPIQIQNLRGLLVSDFRDLAYLFNNLNTERSIVLTAALENPEESRTLTISASGHSTEHVPVTQRIEKRGTRNHSEYESDNSGAVLKTSVHKAHSLHYDAKISRGRNAAPFDFGGRINVRSAENIETSKWGLDNNSDFTLPAALLRPRTNYTSSLIADVIVNKEADDLVKILRDTNFNISSLAVKDHTVFVDCGLERMMPINMFGDGLVRAIGILAHCIRGQIRVLLIDEIESGLHYTTMTVFLSILIKLAERAGVQIFATTHSIDVLRSIQHLLSDDKSVEFRDKVVCYSLAKGADESISSFPYRYEEFDHCIQNRIEIR